MIATSTKHTGAAHALQARIDRFLAGIGQGFNTYVEHKSRLPQIRKLDAMTDAELAAMQIKREDIPAYVFRDVMYI